MKNYENLFIEPFFECKYSTNSSTKLHYRRQLQNEAETDEEETETTEICTTIGDIMLPIIIISLCVVPLLIPLIPVMILQTMLTWYFVSTGQCSNPVADIDIWSPELWTEASTVSSVAAENPNSNFNSRNLNTGTATSFPASCADWTVTNSKGKCSYSKCYPMSKIGDEQNLSECFFNIKNGFCSSGDDNPGNGIISEDMIKSIGFKDAFAMKTMCYSSSYRREICDATFYKTMINTCILADSKVNDIAFPMNSSTLSENCHLLSVFLFLTSKIFGQSRFEFLQLEQKRYQETGCSSALRTIQI